MSCEVGIERVYAVSGGFVGFVGRIWSFSGVVLLVVVCRNLPRGRRVLRPFLSLFDRISTLYCRVSREV